MVALYIDTGGLLKLCQLHSIMVYREQTKLSWNSYMFYIMLMFAKSVNFFEPCNTINRRKKRTRQTLVWLHESNLGFCTWKLKKKHRLPQQWHELAYIRNVHFMLAKISWNNQNTHNYFNMNRRPLVAKSPIKNAFPSLNKFITILKLSEKKEKSCRIVFLSKFASPSRNTRVKHLRKDANVSMRF